MRCLLLVTAIGIRIAIGLAIAPAATATPDPHARVRQLGERWLAAVRAGSDVRALTRLLLAVTESGVCFTAGTGDRPVLRGVTGPRHLRAVVAAVRACVPARARVLALSDDSGVAIEWGEESISQLILTLDGAGRVTAIADHFAYGGP